jgi:hypothetical protein
MIASLLAQAIADGIVPASFAQRCINSPKEVVSAAPSDLPDALDLGAPMLVERSQSVDIGMLRQASSPTLSNVARVGLLARAKLLTKKKGKVAVVQEESASIRPVEKLCEKVAAILSR